MKRNKQIVRNDEIKPKKSKHFNWRREKREYVERIKIKRITPHKERAMSQRYA